MATFPSRPQASPLKIGHFSGAGNITGPGGLQQYLNELEVHLSALAAGVRPPRIEYVSDSVVEINTPPGAQYATIILQDNIRRIIETVEQVDLLNSGPGGIDTGVVVANSFYYIYGIQSTTEAYGLDLIASLSPPTSGPLGYAYYRHLGAIRTDAKKRILKFDQYGANFSLRVMRSVEAKQGYVADVEGLHEVDMSQLIPATAASCVMVARLRAEQSGSGTLRFYVDGSQSEGHHDYLQTSSIDTDVMMKTLQMPTPTTPKKIYRHLELGGQGILYYSLDLNGWKDGYLL
jgi:hypothetical protein